MALPAGLPTKQLRFGMYSTATGKIRVGTIYIGMSRPVLHVPTNSVITTQRDGITISQQTGDVTVTIPVTDHPDLIADWSGSPNASHRLVVEMELRGLPRSRHELVISLDDDEVIDFDALVGG